MAQIVVSIFFSIIPMYSLYIFIQPLYNHPKKHPKKKTARPSHRVLPIGAGVTQIPLQVPGLRMK